jgi:hypothetical protein
MRLVYITSSHNSAKPIVLKKKFLIEIFLTVRLLFSYKLYNQDNKKPNLMSSHQKSYGCHHIFDHPYGRSVTQSIAACLQYEVRITLPSIDFGNQNHKGMSLTGKRVFCAILSSDFIYLLNFFCALCVRYLVQLD